MSNLDMSLDDMIKMNKKSRGSGNPRSGARNSGTGPSRRLPRRSSNRATPYAVGKVEAPETTWGHEMFENHNEAYRTRPNRISSGIETGTKLLITNLDYGVSNEDIKELFAEVGDIKRASIHYDRSGRSKGTAEIVFSRRRDAELAFKRYDNVQLDGKPMKINLVGTNMGNDGAAVPSALNVMNGNQNAVPRSQNRGGVMGRLRGGGRRQGRGGGGSRGGGGGRGRGRGGGRDEVVSVEDLDADLDKYHAESMQTN